MTKLIKELDFEDYKCSFLERVFQVSTVRGIILLLGVCGYAASPVMEHTITVIVGGLIALIEIIRNENKKGG